MAVYELEVIKKNRMWGFRIHVINAIKKVRLTYIDSKERFKTEEEAEKAGERYKEQLPQNDPKGIPQ